MGSMKGGEFTEKLSNYQIILAELPNGNYKRSFKRYTRHTICRCYEILVYLRFVVNKIRFELVFVACWHLSVTMSLHHGRQEVLKSSRGLNVSVCEIYRTLSVLFPCQNSRLKLIRTFVTFYILRDSINKSNIW